MNEMKAERRAGLPLWLILTLVFLVIFNGLPFLAPVFMKLGWEMPGRAIYLLYAPMCHQMAQRSFFLFGPEGFQMYSLQELPIDPGANVQLATRLFLGNSAMGWKVAWSDRMVAMFGSPLVVAIAFAFLRQGRTLKPSSWWLFGVLLLPMLIDGGTHMISDVSSGIGQGFRDSNLWLATLTGHLLPSSFYAGDGLGSFNSLMRLFSGLTFGIAIGGLLYPAIDLSVVQINAAPDTSASVLPEQAGGNTAVGHSEAGQVGSL